MPFDASYSTNPVLTQAISQFQLTQRALDFMRKMPFVESYDLSPKVPIQDIAAMMQQDTEGQPMGVQINTSSLSKDYVNFNMLSYTDATHIVGVEASKMNEEGFAIQQQRLANDVAVRASNKFLKKIQDTAFRASSYPITNATMDISNVAIDNGILNKIEDGKEAINKQSNTKANTLILTGDVWTAMKKQKELKDTNGGGNPDPRVPIDVSWMSRITGIENIIVLDTVINSAKRNATPSKGYLSSGFALLCAMNPFASLNDSSLPTFMMGVYQPNRMGALGLSPTVQTMAGVAPFPITIADDYEPFTTGGGLYKVMAEIIADVKILYPELGYLWTVTV